MTGLATSDTRRRLIAAAADLVSAAPGEEVSLRAICDAVGVKLPTLYHFFGSKQGLVDAVIEHGFDLYLDEKSAMESTGDPIQDIRAGWDAHVAFGLTNPGFYTLMYGKIRPGYSPVAQSRANEILQAITARAAEQGRLAVPSEQAAAHVLATNIGLTLRQIIMATPDPTLAAAVREGTIAAITGTNTQATNPFAVAIERAASRPEVLGQTQTQLLIEWLTKLAEQNL